MKDIFGNFIKGEKMIRAIDDIELVLENWDGIWIAKKDIISLRLGVITMSYIFDPNTSILNPFKGIDYVSLSIPRELKYKSIDEKEYKIVDRFKRDRDIVYFRLCKDNGESETLRVAWEDDDNDYEQNKLCRIYSEDIYYDEGSDKEIPILEIEIGKKSNRF